LPLRIVSIKKIKSRSSLLEIALSDHRKIRLHADIAYKRRIRAGDEIKAEQVSRLLNEQKLFDLKNAALRLLSRRPHSKRELELKLIGRKFPRDDIGRALNEIESEGYLNDEEFARLFAAERLRLKPRSRRMISEELKKRGISREIIEKVIPDIFQDTDEKDLALNLIKKSPGRFSGYYGQELKLKLLRFLRNRGFDYSTSAEAADLFMKENATRP
jgi:regulatory protein